MEQENSHPRFNFLREGIRNFRETGSIAPSSRYLCKKIADKIDPTNANIVVELGPGDGVITRYILDRIHKDAKLLIFEINDAFVKRIRNSFDDPRLVVIHDSAEVMGKYFETHGITHVDYFISGIPFSIMQDNLKERIITTCRDWLRPKGLFVQFHYTPLTLRDYRKIFGNIDVDVVALNFPPAIVVTCEKNR